MRKESAPSLKERFAIVFDEHGNYRGDSKDGPITFAPH